MGDQPANRIPREALLAEIERLADGDDPPSATDMRADGKYSAATYHHRFGSWSDTLAATGLDPIRQSYTDEELCAELRRLADELGRVPTSTDVDEHGRMADNTVYERFGSWTDALAAAGIDPDDDEA